MPKSCWIRDQTLATEALIKFMRDHDSEPDSDLQGCVMALRSGDIDGAVAYAKRVKPHGMGGLTDWWPPVKFANEEAEYVSAVHRALVNEWCRLISLSFEKN